LTMFLLTPTQLQSPPTNYILTSNSPGGKFNSGRNVSKNL